MISIQRTCHLRNSLSSFDKVFQSVFGKTAVTEEEHGLGSVVGAFVGDAAGAPLEFISIIDDEKVGHALTFSGGGPINAGPGQFTDDSELAMCQIQVLKDLSPTLGFPFEKMRAGYRRWYESRPFDMGTTTIQALGIPLETPLDKALEEIALVNANSKANGAMMRMTPLAVWVRFLPLMEQVAIFQSDPLLSHPNQTVQDACTLYGLAIANLVKSKGDIQQSLVVVEEWLPNVNPEVQEWYRMSQSLEIDTFEVTPQIGFVKWGFVLAFHFLIAGASYREAITITLRKGGDTDTNAAIVGGLVGASLGLNQIPKEWRDAMLGYVYNEDHGVGYYRPEFLQPGNLYELMRSLLQISS